MFQAEETAPRPNVTFVGSDVCKTVVVKDGDERRKEGNKGTGCVGKVGACWLFSDSVNVPAIISAISSPRS